MNKSWITSRKIENSYLCCGSNIIEIEVEIVTGLITPGQHLAQLEIQTFTVALLVMQQKFSYILKVEFSPRSLCLGWSKRSTAH